MSKRPGGRAIRVRIDHPDSDRHDLATAREFLAQKLGPLQLGAEMMRLSAAADRLVRTPSVQQKIRLIADALLQRGSLTAAEIAALSDAALRA